MEPINPFEIEDILQIIAPFLNARITYAAGNSLLRNLWMRKGKISADLGKMTTNDLLKYSKYINVLNCRALILGNVISDHLVFPKVTKIIIDHLNINILEFCRTFPNLEVLIVKNTIYPPINWIGITSLPLKKIHANIDLKLSGNTDLYQTYGIVERFPDIQTYVSDINLQDLIMYINEDDNKEKVGVCKVQCPFKPDHNLQYTLIKFCKEIRFQMGDTSIPALIFCLGNMLSSLQNTDLIQSKNIPRDLTLIIGKLSTKENENKDVNLSTLYISLGVIIKEFRELGIDLNINTSLKWFSDLFKRLKK